MIDNSLITVSQLQRDYSRILSLLKRKKSLALYRYNRQVAFLVSPSVLKKLIRIKEKYEEMAALREINFYREAKKDKVLARASSVEDLFSDD